MQKLFAFRRGKSPVEIKLPQSPDEMMQAHGDRDRNVKALREAVHRDSHHMVTERSGCLRRPFFFVAEQQRRRLCDVVRFEIAVGSVRTGRDDLIPVGFQSLDAGGCGVAMTIRGLMPMHRQPLSCSPCDVASDVETVSIFDDVKVLNPEAITTAKTRAGVVCVTHILNDNRQVPGSFEDEPLQQVAPLVGHESRQVGSQLPFVKRVLQTAVLSAAGEFFEEFFRHR